MRAKLKVLGLMAVLSWMLLVPAVAGAVDAVLYETTEKAFLLVTIDGPYTLDPAEAQFRLGIAALEGTANFDSPFCFVPFQVGQVSGPSCAVTAFGSTTIELKGLNAGTGSVDASFQTSVNGDNPVDAPEVVLANGNISGVVWVDMPSAKALAALARGKKSVLGPDIPILRMSGTYSAKGVGALKDLTVSAPFTATFRLPFALDNEGQRQKPARGEKAFYLADDGRKIRVDKNEYVLGFPMVRVEVTFVPSPTP